MGKKCYFMDDVSYSASDVNAALTTMLTSGVLLYNDTGSPLNDLNAAISQVASGGVISNYNSDSLKVSIKNGAYHIAQGAAICPTGAIISVDSAGHDINQTPKAGDYIYIRHNVEHNTIEFIVSESQGDSESVHLASYSGGSDVTDMREPARAKLLLSTGNIAVTISGNKFRNYRLTVDFGWSGFNGIEIYDSAFVGKKNIFGDMRGTTSYTEIGYLQTRDGNAYISARRNGTKVELKANQDIDGIPLVITAF